MGGDHLWVHFRQRIEGTCGGISISGAANVPGFLDMEEELLDDAAELDRLLLRERSLLEGPAQDLYRKRLRKGGCEELDNAGREKGATDDGGPNRGRNT